MRLIDADKLHEKVTKIGVQYAKEGKEAEDRAVLKCLKAIKDAPTVTEEFAVDKELPTI